MPTHVHMIVEVRHELPFHTVRGKQVRWTLSDIIRGFEKGCTSQYYRLLEQHYGFRPQAPSLWNPDGFNDRVLLTPEMQASWERYIALNAYYWKLETDYPHLFERQQHIRVADTDYSSYGCMFLLRRNNRLQVQCTRLATKGMLTPAEWAEFSRPERARQFEADRARDHLARYNPQWLTSPYPDCKTPIPYPLTQAFLQQKARLLQACEEEQAVLVSPAVSRGEQEIFYAALEQGYPCIKLQKTPFAERDHAGNQDRAYCARGQLLVLGPWEIHGTHSDSCQGWQSTSQPTPCSGTLAGSSPSLWSRFHNLNDMAAELCKEFDTMSIDRTHLS